MSKFAQSEESTIQMILDKLANGEVSQLGDMEISDEIWEEVRKRRGPIADTKANKELGVTKIDLNIPADIIQYSTWELLERGFTVRVKVIEMDDNGFATEYNMLAWRNCGKSV